MLIVLPENQNLGKYIIFTPQEKGQYKIDRPFKKLDFINKYFIKMYYIKYANTYICNKNKKKRKVVLLFFLNKHRHTQRERDTQSIEYERFC